MNEESKFKMNPEDIIKEQNRVPDSEFENREKLEEVDITNKAKDYANNLFETYLSNPENISEEITVHNLFFEVRNKLNILAGNAKEIEDEIIYNEKFEKATKVFVEELLNFCKEHKNDKNFEKFSYLMSKSLFLGSPDITEPIGLKDNFDLATRASRMREIQGAIGGDMVEGLAYKINDYYKPETKEDTLFDDFVKSPISEKLDKLHLLENLMAYSIGGGEPLYESKRKLTKLLKKIKLGNKSFFVDKYISIVEERIDYEKENPTRGIVRFEGDPSSARLVDFLSEEEINEARRLAKFIYPDAPLKKKEKIIQVGQDLIAIFDHSNTPVKFAKIDFLPPSTVEAPVSAIYLREIKEALKPENEIKDNITFDELISYASRNTLKPYHKISDKNIGTLAEKWSSFSETISKEEWLEFLELKQRALNLMQEVSNFEKIKDRETEEKNFEESGRFYEYFKEKAKSILEPNLGIREENKKSLKNLYQEFIEAYKENDLEHAHATIDEFVSLLKFIANGEKLFFKEEPGEKNASPEVLELIDRHQALRAIHVSNWKGCEDAINKYYQEQAKKEESNLLRLGELREIIFQDKENITKNLKQEIEKIEKEIGKNFIKADFIDYEQMIEKYEHIFFQSKNPQEMGLLFEHLHRPKMRKIIEKELGVDLNEIPFRFQAYLLEFLSDKAKKEVIRVREFLLHTQSKEAKNSRIKSFLSLEAGQEMGDRILSIGENLDSKSADLVFAEYAEIVNLTQISREGLESLFKDRKEVRAQEVENITQNLLKKANELLINFAAKSEQVKREELDTSRISEELERYKKDLIFAASVLKGIDKETGVKFEDLKGVTFEQKTAPDFSEEEKSQMLKIYRKNYETRPKLQEKLLDAFVKTLEEGKDVAFYIYKINDEIVAFNRFDQIDRSKKQVASLNVEPTLQNSAIGTALLETSLKKEGEKNVIIAYCDASPLAGSCYLTRKGGFVAKEFFPNYEDTGAKSLGIERKEINQNYHYYNFTNEKIIEDYNKDPKTIENALGQKHFILKLKPDSSKLFDALEELINKNGYAMTKYFSTKDANQIYCTFEKAID